MAITFQAKSDQSSSTSYAFDVGSGSNRFMFVLVMRRAGSSTTVTFNGVSMTSLGNLDSIWNSGDHSEMFVLANPASGSHNIVITHNGSLVRSCAGAYNGVNQTTPTSNFTTHQSASSAPQSVSVTPSQSSWIIASGWIAVSTTLSPDGNTTMRTVAIYGANPVLDSNGTKTSAYAIGYSDSIAGDLLAFALIEDTITQTITATTAITSSVFKQLPKTLAATSTVTASMVKQMAKTLASSVSVSASMFKSLAKTLLGNVSVTASMVATKVFLETLDAISSITATLTKIPGKLLSASTTVTADITKLSMLARTLGATASVSAAMTKGLSKTLGATASVTSVLTKIPAKLLTATTAITASIDKSLTKVLTATATITADIVIARAVIMNATATATAEMSKLVGKLLSVTTTITAKVIAPFWRTKYPAHGDGDDYNIKYPHD